MGTDSKSAARMPAITNFLMNHSLTEYEPLMEIPCSKSSCTGLFPEREAPRETDYPPTWSQGSESFSTER